MNLQVTTDKRSYDSVPLINDQSLPSYTTGAIDVFVLGSVCPLYQQHDCWQENTAWHSRLSLMNTAMADYKDMHILSVTGFVTTWVLLSVL